MSEVPDEPIHVPDMEMSVFDTIRVGETDLEEILRICGTTFMVAIKPGIYHYKRYRLTIERGDILYSPRPPTPGWLLQIHQGNEWPVRDVWQKSFHGALNWFINYVEERIGNASR
jgi:hypothetical protein